MLLARVRGARAPTDPVLDPPMLIVAAAFFYFPNFFHQIYDRFRHPFFKQRMILIILVRTSPTVQTLIQIQNASCTLFCLSKSHSNGRCNRVLIFPTTRDVTLICITSLSTMWRVRGGVTGSGGKELAWHGEESFVSAAGEGMFWGRDSFTMHDPDCGMPFLFGFGLLETYRQSNYF